jgi:hypothetical protein
MNTGRLLAYLDAPAQFPETEAHLATCPVCRGKLARLVQAALAAQVAYRPPDLSFLRRVKTPEHFRELIRRGTYWVQDRVEGLFLDLGEFLRLPVLEPMPAFALATRGRPAPAAESEEGLLYEITLGPENLEDLDVTVKVYRQPERPKAARVVIHVIVPSRLVAGFAGSQVALKAGQITRSARSDDDGLVVFEEVPLAELGEVTFTITPP